jgi:RimJ/RimL family protein N-acetyltransferase
MNISYRALLPEDAAKYRQLRLESLRQHPDKFGSSYLEESQLDKLMFERAIEERAGDRVMMGAWQGKSLIGLCGFLAHNFYEVPRHGVIIQTYVREAYRGKGIALALVRATLEAAFDAFDIDGAVLEVAAHNKRAIRVYQRAGFEFFAVGEAKAEPGAVYMRLRWAS